MIINKSSFERGFGAGTIYKAVFVDLVEISSGRKNAGRESDSCDLLFARDPNRPELAKFIDVDGLPYPGVPLTEGDPMCCYFSETEHSYTVKWYEPKEPAIVDAIKACGNDRGTGQRSRICISLRILRNPSVGDKFASRAGQKGKQNSQG